MAFMGAVARNVGVLGRIGSAVNRALRGTNTATRTVAGVTAGAAAADVLIIPAAESVTGRDLPGGHVVRDAISGAANSAGQVLGVAHASGTRGIAEGAVMGLLPGTSESDARGLVTVAVLVIGATFLVTALRR